MISSASKNTTNPWFKDTIYLAPILLLGLCLRLWGISWGFPRIDLNPDELNILNISMRITLKDLNPHYYSYCGLTFYLNYFSTHLLSLFHFNMDPFHHLLVHRLWSVFWGTLTIILCYLSAKELFDNKRVAYIAAAFMSIVPLHVWDSHFGTTDIGLTFWMTFAFWLSVRAYRSPSIMNYLLGGIVVGFAIGVKFNGALAVFSFLPAVILTFMEQRISWQKVVQFLAIAFIGIVLAFFISSPYSFLDYHRTIAAFDTESAHTRIIGHFGFDLSAKGWQYHPYVYQVFSAFPFSLGFFLWLGSIVGAFFLIIKGDFKKKIQILSFPIVYFFIFASWKFVPIRYYLPLIPFLIIISSYFFDSLIRSRPKWGILVLSGVFIYTAAFSITSTDRFKRDTRIESASWAVHNLRSGSEIYFVDPHFGFSYGPALDSKIFHSIPISLSEMGRLMKNNSLPLYSIFCLSSLDYGRYYRQKVDREGIQLWDSIRKHPETFYKIKTFESWFLNKSMYCRLDPMYEGYFISPTIEFYQYFPKKNQKKTSIISDHG